MRVLAKVLGPVYAYSPYGEVAVLGPDGGNDLQYGALRNDGTGLYHATYRYYDPVLKQWISDDPIGIRGGINLRAYVRGNPITFADPRGLWNFVFGGGAAAAGGVAGTPASGQFDIESGGYFNLENGEFGAYQTTGGPSGGEVGGANGPYGGLFAGAGMTIGLISGSAENVGGTFQNLNVQIPGTLFGIVIYYDPNNRPQGAALTIGPGGGAGRTRTNTRLFPANRGAPVGQNFCRPQ